MKIFCVQCKRETHHSIKSKIEKRLHDDDSGEWYIGTWHILECKGCEDVSFRQSWVSSDDQDPETGEYNESVKLFPLRGEDVLPQRNYFNAPTNLRSIYREMIDAYNYGMNILCAGGLRATLEGICNAEKIIDGEVTKINKEGKSVTRRTKDLIGKISGLHEKGLVTKNHAEILHEHRFLGNEALHTLDTPTKKELKIAIEIIEHTLDNLYEINQKAEELKSQRATRHSKKKKTP
jgi:hypothetical protein